VLLRLVLAHHRLGRATHRRAEKDAQRQAFETRTPHRLDCPPPRRFRQRKPAIPSLATLHPPAYKDVDLKSMATYRKNVAVGATMIVALLTLGFMIILFGDAPVKFFRKAQM